MDLNDLFLSCRKGDLNQIKYLVEQKDVELNTRDKWDSTPLYYACLCGHLEVVKYLLENGARCETNTFDGERCLYGALNTEIRNILKNYKVVTKYLMRRDSYYEFLRRCLEDGDYYDVTFVVHQETFCAHRCILSVRCEYFNDMFRSKWKNRKSIFITHPMVKSSAFRAVLQYLYTGRLETPIDQIEDCIILAKQCKILELIEKIKEAMKKVKSFECTKPGTNVTTILIEPDIDSSDLQRDFGVLAEQTLPHELCEWVGGDELPFLPNLCQSLFADLCIQVQDYHFYCHKIFFCGRSDYFKVLTTGNFIETQCEGKSDITIVTLHDISMEVFLRILMYIYRNSTELTTSNVYDVLCTADMYLLPGLKCQCASYIAQQLDKSNIFFILRIARLFKLPRLEDQCAEFMSKHLEEIVETPEFNALVKEDALEVKERQDTDSIAVIDDIRYHITSNVQTFSEMEEANDKLSLIDNLLENLGLEG
ncbi:ankyrin repeat and BTB/POZ domain-containing protein 1-like [Tachypleus tridentatus]|uniref:ankyrin repeat and BTB/POZ domain-containing protein 1-like n=1 Tax=Tachypleus tridentatus TaxID=6853 RepID=UPI003FD60B4E